MSRGCGFLLFWHHSYEVTLIHFCFLDQSTVVITVVFVYYFENKNFNGLYEYRQIRPSQVNSLFLVRGRVGFGLSRKKKTTKYQYVLYCTVKRKFFAT